MTPEVWAGVEATVNRVGDAYHDQLEASGHARRLADLDLFADLGITAIRYPVLWERTHDWSWSDERLARLRELEIRPIVGLVHHGSGPPDTSLLDPQFPEKLAAYARRVAERYPWVEDWTPVNEPLTTARFSCLYGFWYPHRREAAPFARAIINQVRAVVLAMRAIREVIPGARLIQTDDLGKTHSTEPIAYQAAHENERRWTTWDLLCGRPTGVDKWFRWIGVDEPELGWFAENPCPPDVVGINHYLSSERFLDHRLDRYPPHLHGSNGKDAYVDELAARILGPGPDGPAKLLLEAWERYRLPLAVTEAHNGCTREEQLRWLDEVWRAARLVQTKGADVRAVTIWTLLGTYGWNEMLTRGTDFYEPGVFDVRAPRPRPTALATMTRSLARRGSFEHPVLDTAGWWRRPERLWYPAVGPIARPRTGRRARPLLITGATGTLGRAFAAIAEERGLAHVLTNRRRLDGADPGSVEAALAAIRPWAVVNTAGYVRVDEAQADQPSCYRENTLAASTLARACAVRSIPLLTFSTDLVFDGRKRAPYVEDDETAPLNVYGESKAEAERLVMAVHDGALVARTSAFFGPWDDHNFVTRALEALTSGRPYAAPDDAVVSPTYVPDLVQTSLDLLIDGERGIWHLANTGALTWCDLAMRVAEAAEIDAGAVVPVASAEVGWTAPRPAYSALASTRGAVMPALDDAIARYTGAREAQKKKTTEAVKGAA
ncbi:MAG: sugar nucleotide-binding protein [Gaiellaceae bacterium]|jgi:dTDP-4-dehydrorhamnose reductase